MLPRLIGSLVWFPALVGLGSLLLLFIRRRIVIPQDIGNLMFLLLAGIACLGTIANVVNYFTPIGTLLPDIALIAGWILLIVNWRHIGPLFMPTTRQAILKFALLFIVILVACAYYSQRGFLNIDVPGYHFPAVKWTADSRLPVGLANVDPWLGNYLWFQAAAMLEAVPTNNYSAFILNTMFLSAFALMAWNRVSNGLRDALQPSQIFLYLCVATWGLFVFFSPKEIYSFTPNFATAVLAVLSVYVTLRATEQLDNWLYYFVISALLGIVGLTIKISNIALLSAPCVILLNYRQQVRLQLATYARKSLLILIPVSLLLVVPWLIRGVVTSGCLIFPVANTCLPSLPWALPQDAVREEAIAVQRTNQAMNAFVIPNYNSEEFNSNFHWLPYWINWMMTQEARTLPLLAALALGCILWVLTLVIDRTHPLDHQLPFLLSGIAPLVMVVFWFFTAPGMNYIYGSFAAIDSLVIGSAIYRLVLISPKFTCWAQSLTPRLGTIAVAVLILVIGGKIGKDAINHQTAILLDWPQLPKPVTVAYTADSGVVYYVAQNGQLCSDSPVPCTTTPNLSIAVDKYGNITEITALTNQQPIVPPLDP